MYREWLEKMLENRPRGTKARLSEHIGGGSDVVSKMLSGVRAIAADELPLIAEYFETMPPGFEKLIGSSKQLIQGDAEILATLSRIENLSDDDIAIAYGVIRNAIAAKRGVPGPSESHGQPQPANLRRE